MIAAKITYVLKSLTSPDCPTLWPSSWPTRTAFHQVISTLMQWKLDMPPASLYLFLNSLACLTWTWDSIIHSLSVCACMCVYVCVWVSTYYFILWICEDCIGSAGSMVCGLLKAMNCVETNFLNWLIGFQTVYSDSKKRTVVGWRQGIWWGHAYIYSNEILTLGAKYRLSIANS